LRNSGIAGFAVPGLADRLVASLFADDTTVFLSESDSYVELTRILQRWCTASRARFNSDKTAVIPVGTKQYREHVLASRYLSTHGVGDKLPDGVSLVPDGQATRVLGAWVGNEVDDTAAWAEVVDTIRRHLDRWRARRPTLNARRLIVNLEVGARTQFLARAQSMPPSVEKTLQKMVLDFVWDHDPHHRVSADTLHKPITEGGLALLNVGVRNEALDLLWMKEYLDLSETRP
ncbi:hypothetical protein GY45DRAFT_1211632, partial [Cubamyces sp. BRFM 1775]